MKGYKDEWDGYAYPQPEWHANEVYAVEAGAHGHGGLSRLEHATLMLLSGMVTSTNLPQSDINRRLLTRKASELAKSALLYLREESAARIAAGEKV